MDSGGRIHDIGGDTNDYDDIDAQYTGLLKVRSDYVDRLVDAYRAIEADADEEYVSIDTTAFIQRLIDDGWHVQGVPVDGGWLEVDTTEDFEQYQTLHAAGYLSDFVNFDAE